MPRTTKAGRNVKTKPKITTPSDVDIDGGGAPKKPPAIKGEKVHAAKAPSGGGVPAAVLAKAAAIGARNGGAAPSPGGARPGTPVGFVGSPAESGVQEFSAGAAPAELSGVKK